MSHRRKKANPPANPQGIIFYGGCSRRDFLKSAGALGLLTVLGVEGCGRAVGSDGRIIPVKNFSSAAGQTPLPAASIPQFADSLPALNTLAGKTSIELEMREFQTNVLPSSIKLPGNKPYTGTWVWGYLESSQVGNPSKISSYIGPVIVATRGTPIEAKFINNLGNAGSTKVLAYKNSTDQTLHWADPLHGGKNTGSMNEKSGHLPQPPYNQNYSGPIPAVVHLHGGEVPPVLDGGPLSWFTSDGKMQGSQFYSKEGTKAKNWVIYSYPNKQEAAPLWFHDHTLGATRLNVYAGMAGAYLVVDPNLKLPTNLPGLTDIIPLVIQDRMFDTDGQLYFPTASDVPEHPFWVPEFTGDTIVVNGKAWPYKDVQPKRYRFLFLNGSNARPYDLAIPGVSMWVIGNDGGYLDDPAQINHLVLLPGERYEVIIDFSKAAGQNLVMANSANSPYPDGDPVDPATTGTIMQFRVGKTAVPDNSYDPASGTPLRTGAQKIVRLADPVSGTLAAGITPAKTRALTLNEADTMPVTINGVNYAGGPTAAIINNTSWDGMRKNVKTGADEPLPGSTPDGAGNNVTELPKEGETEVWEFINLTPDAHPIHLHLAQFQILNRQAYDAGAYQEAYGALFPASVQIDPETLQPYPGGKWIEEYGPPLDYSPSAASGGKYGGNPDVTKFLEGDIMPPKPEESGWKDTVLCPPETITRIVVRWSPTDAAANAVNPAYPFDPAAGGKGYVWHCHIIDHEDNEMMRPAMMQPLAGAKRSFVLGSDY